MKVVLFSLKRRKNMNIYQVRNLLRTKSIFDLPLRVSYYARVSTERDDQKNSIDNQIQYYENLIMSISNWNFAGGYVDFGITGLHTEKRDDFNRMISDSRNGKMDLIITKEISRFARNTLDSIKYTRDLLSYGTCVWFQNDNINTIDEDSEFRLTIMAGVAQDELRKLSSRVRFGHAQAIKNGVVLGNSRIYGWDKDHGKLVVNPKEAEMIRTIYTKYATGEWSTSKLEKHLYELGYRNHNGRKIDRNVIRHIIPNPKYKGYYAGGKVKIVDMLTKKQKFLPQDEWIMYKDESGEIVPAIIDEDTWEKANYYFQMRGDLIKSRRTSYKSNNIFKHKIICANDGAYYWMKQHGTKGKNGEHNPVWGCSRKTTDGAKSCDSSYLRENELCILIAKLLRGAAGNMDVICNLYIETYHKVLKRQEKSAHTEIDRLKTQLDSLKAKSEKILEYNLNGAISDEEFLRRNSDYRNQITQLEKQCQDLEEISSNSASGIEEKIRRVAECITQYSDIQPSDFTPQIIDRLFEKIIAKPINKNSVELTFVCRTGENFIDTYNKKIIPSGEHDVQYILQTEHNYLLAFSEVELIEERYMIRGENKIVDFAYNGRLII